MSERGGARQGGRKDVCKGCGVCLSSFAVSPAVSSKSALILNVSYLFLPFLFPFPPSLQEKALRPLALRLLHVPRLPPRPPLRRPRLPPPSLPLRPPLRRPRLPPPRQLPRRPRLPRLPQHPRQLPRRPAMPRRAMPLRRCRWSLSITILGLTRLLERSMSKIITCYETRGIVMCVAWF